MLYFVQNQTLFTLSLVWSEAKLKIIDSFWFAVFFFSQEKATEERVQRLKQRFMSAYDVTADGKLQIQEVQFLMPHYSQKPI